MRSFSAALAEICGTTVTHFKLETIEADRGLKEATISKCRGSFCAAPCHNSIELVRGAAIFSDYAAAHC